MAALDDMVDAVLPDIAPLTAERRARVGADCALSVRRQIGAAPLQIRGAFQILFSAFVVFLLLTARRMPSQLTRGQRSQSLGRFTRATPATFATVERLIRSLALLAYYEHPEVLIALGGQDLAAHQAERRRLWRAARDLALASAPAGSRT
jgi:hypothetical protein